MRRKYTQSRAFNKVNYLCHTLDYMEELKTLAESYDLSHTCSDSDVMSVYNGSDNIEHKGSHET